MMDHASRYPDAVPLKNIDSESVAEALVDMFSRVGVPEKILSDLGTQFTSDCMKEVARLLSMRQLTTTPYHPMCNGLVEKFNGTLKQMLKKLCQEKPNQWHRYINAVLFAYREVPQESTGFSPFEILYGRSVRGPMQILRELWTKHIEEPEVKSSYQYVFELREKMEETMKLANEALKLAQGRYKHYYDRRCRPRSLQVGDQVLILLPTDSNKLLMQWKGPFNVENIVGKNDYGINIQGKVRTFHINMLKKYLQRAKDVILDTACAVSKPYPVPYGVRASLRKEIKDMLDMGIIQESASPYASPVVMVKKSDGSNRVCIDFRKLNRITIFDPEPMVTADDVFARLSESNFFTKIDFTKGYWQIKVRSEDVPKTAFVTPDGQYEFLKMPFGMVNAGDTYVKCMRTLLKGLDNVESYIDDLLVHTKSWSEHLETLQELFQRIQNTNLTVRPSKCILASETVQFLGHEIQGGTLSLQETNISKIQSAPQPKTKKEVRSFLGLTGFYRAYVPNYATIAAPLSDLTKKGKINVVQWQEPQEKAYNSLKSILVNKPVLHLPDLNRRFILRTDASDVGLGAVLLQEYEDGLFPQLLSIPSVYTLLLIFTKTNMEAKYLLLLFLSVVSCKNINSRLFIDLQGENHIKTPVSTISCEDPDIESVQIESVENVICSDVVPSKGETSNITAKFQHEFAEGCELQITMESREEYTFGNPLKVKAKICSVDDCHRKFEHCQLERSKPQTKHFTLKVNYEGFSLCKLPVDVHTHYKVQSCSL
ncbi:uncharacterized protein [Palaemon carinicauda]|uniref:uncharacterized protein n=1 Tax=Palaemon carinicauda TaxID=392227 RepID=UPI0035B5AEF2